MNFKIYEDDLDDFISNVFCIWIKAKVLGGFEVPAKLMYYWILLNLLNAFRLEKCLRKASIYKSMWKLSDMRLNLIGDTCHDMSGGTLILFLQDTWHHLIGQNVLIFKMTRVNTRLDCLCHCQHMSTCDWLLHAFYSFVLVTLIVCDTL